MSSTSFFFFFLMPIHLFIFQSTVHIPWYASPKHKRRSCDLLRTNANIRKSITKKKQSPGFRGLCWNIRLSFVILWQKKHSLERDYYFTGEEKKILCKANACFEPSSQKGNPFLHRINDTIAKSRRKFVVETMDCSHFHRKSFDSTVQSVIKGLLKNTMSRLCFHKTRKFMAKLFSCL